MDQLPAADRFSDARTDNPYWNENSWFSFSIPERHIHGFVQYCFRPNMGMLIGGPVLWDHKATQQWNCLYYNWSHLQAAPAGARKFDLTARNSLAVKVLEPLKRYKIDYNREGFEMDLVWEAVGPHHEMRSDDPTKNAAAAFHIEQPGRMKGTIRRHGEEFRIDCGSMRDCSSGPYDADFTTIGAYFWGISDRGSFLSLCMGNGRETRGVGGYLMLDGVTADLVSARRTIVEYGDVAPSKVVFEATDRIGRTMNATGTIDPGLIFTAYTDHTVVWSLLKWDWGSDICWGDNQEFYPSETFRRIARKEIALG